MRALIRAVFRLKKRLFAKYYTWRVQRAAKSCGEGLKVNGRSSITRNTYLGDNVSFNGMKIGGGG